MTYKQRRFTDDEVLEILGHHPRMSCADIARLFKAHPSTIHNILTGKTYRSVTHDDSPGKPCQCPACRTAKQADANIQAIHESVVTVECFFCQHPVEVSVRQGLDMHGEIPCGTCAGGRRK